MALMKATHTITDVLAVEVFPRTFVAADGAVHTRTSATKWGLGLNILLHTGEPATVEINDHQMALAQQYSEVEARLLAED